MSERFDCFISPEKAKLYNAMTEEPHSIYYKHSKSQVYVAAAAYGYCHKLREPINGKKQQLFVSSTFSEDNSYLLWILKSIGISKYGIESLKKPNEMAALCDEYANAGIDELYKIHKNSDDETRDFAIELISILEEQRFPKIANYSLSAGRRGSQLSCASSSASNPWNLPAYHTF